MSDANTTSAGDLTRSLSGAIQSHPLPAALIGMGLVWLFSGGRSWSSTGPGGAYQTGNETRDFSSATSKGASTSSVFGAAQSNIAELIDRQPLVLGAIGISVGAVMAAALPSTVLETELLGQASTDLQARARMVAGDVTERAADLADNVSAAISNEAYKQGLTAENLKQSASDAGERMQNIVAQATERLRPTT